MTAQVHDAEVRRLWLWLPMRSHVIIRTTATRGPAVHLLG